MFFLTTIDKSLTLPLNGRDPLGTQAIWQWRARDVVPALTAASRQAEGFQLLLTALAWWPIFAKRHARPNTDQKKYFLLVEQAFARSWRTHGEHAWPLPGKRRLSSNDPGVWIGLDAQRHFLIDSPLTNGTWGIYRGPLLNAKLIDASNLISDRKFEEFVRRDTKIMEKLFHHLNRALTATPGPDEKLAQIKSNAIVKELVDILYKLPLKNKLKEKLVAPQDSPITAAIADIALQAPEEEGPEALVIRALKRLPDWHKPLTDVLRCERYLAVLDASFEQLCASVLAGDPDPAAGLKVDLTQLRHAQVKFAASGIYQGLADTRRKQLLQAPTRDASGLASFLLEHHGSVSKARGSSPWLSSSDSGRLECRVEVDEPASRQLQPATAWRNSYYLDALRTLAERLSGRAR